MVKLIIDTDVALGVWHEGRPRDIDDGFAIVEALNEPDIELLGVTTVFGNGPHDEVHRVANEILELKDCRMRSTRGRRDVPASGWRSVAAAERCGRVHGRRTRARVACTLPPSARSPTSVFWPHTFRTHSRTQPR